MTSVHTEARFTGINLLVIHFCDSSTDDITTNADGVDAYAKVKAAGKYK